MEVKVIPSQPLIFNEVGSVLMKFCLLVSTSRFIFLFSKFLCEIYAIYSYTSFLIVNELYIIINIK